MTARTIPTDLLVDLLDQLDAFVADKRARMEQIHVARGGPLLEVDYRKKEGLAGYANGMESAAFMLRLLLERQESDETATDGAYGAGRTDDGLSTRVDL